MTETVEIPTLRLSLLGVPQVFLDDDPVDGFVTNKAQALLIYLVLNPGRHTRHRLAGLLWSDSTEEKALRSLRVVLSNLRKLFPNHLEITRQHVSFNLHGPHQVDSDAFRATLEQDLENIDVLEQTLTIYRGDFLEGVYLDEAYGFEEWLLIERENLRHLAILGFEKLADRYHSTRQYAAAVRILHRLLELDSWQETYHRQLMLLLTRSGDLNGALRQFGVCRRFLADELDVEPLPETIRLYERIRALRTLSPPPMPPQPTTFIGRQAEIAQLTQMLMDEGVRLVTVMGLGGVGKTRLALAVAESLRAAFLEGVYFVPLTSVTNTTALFSTVAQTLDVQLQGQADAVQQITTYLQEKEILLVLDNFEQLAGQAMVLESILQRAPAVKLLVTSRERLNLRWERQFLLTGLNYPTDAREADWRTASSVQLFQDAGARVRPGFTLANDERECIVQICHLVEGMPLALELAAAWLRVQNCQEIAAQIQRDLDILSTSLRDIPQRQHSLRVIFETAYTQLSPEVQKAFRQLAVFEGEFSASAAHKIAEITPGILNSLTDASLLRLALLPERQRSLRAQRFTLHPLVRQYATELAAECANEVFEVGNRHSCHYLESIAEIAPGRHNQDQARLDLQKDIDNVRVAWQWAVDHAEVSRLAQALDGVQNYYEIQGPFQEGLDLVQSAITQMESIPDTEENLTWLCRLHLAESGLQTHLGHFSQAQAAAKQALALVENTENPTLIAKGNLALGITLFRLAQYKEASGLLQIAFQQAHKSGVKDVAATSAKTLGSVAYVQNDLNLAEQEFARAEKLYADLDDFYGLSEVRHNQGLIQLSLGNLADANGLFSQALVNFRQLGHRSGISRALHNLGLVALYQSKLDQATQYFEEALNLRRQMGDRAGEAFTLSNLAFITMSNESLSEAYNYATEALAIAQRLEDRRTECHARTVLGTIAIDHGRYSNAWNQFQQTIEISQSTAQPLEEARAQRGLGRTATYLGLYSEAQTYLLAAYDSFLEAGYDFEKKWTAGNLAELYCTTNNTETAQHYIDEILQDRSIPPTIQLESYITRIQADVSWRVGDLASVEACQNRFAALWGEDNAYPEMRTLMAVAYLDAGKVEKALQQVKLILHHLDENADEIGIDDPAFTYLVCYRVLKAIDDKRASTVLKTGYEFLTHRASRIRDEQHRRAYLEKVESHRNLLAVYKDRALTFS